MCERPLAWLLGCSAVLPVLPYLLGAFEHVRLGDFLTVEVRKLLGNT
jgi:hypothetical protein